MITFARSVRSAPSTTTMQLGRASCDPFWPEYPAPRPAPAAPKVPSTRGRVLNPYGDIPTMSGLAGREVVRTLPGGNGTYHPGPTGYIDQFIGGRFAMYYDTTIGAIPTDDDLAKVRGCYTPVASGWIDPASLGDGEATSMSPSTLNKYQQLALALSAASTVAVVASSIVAIWRNVKAAAIEARIQAPLAVKHGG